MAREPNIPLFLWVATAALAHIMWGGGADRAAEVLEGKTSISRFAHAIRGHVLSRNAPVEIALWDEIPPEKTSPDSDATVDSDQETTPDTPDLEKPLAADDPPSKAEKLPETAPKIPQKQERQADKPKPEANKSVLPLPAQPVQLDRRVAVKQTVEDQNQQNPDAEFLGKHANKVAEQTQARVTSTDQHEPDPTPGPSHEGPSQEDGNAIVSDLGQSEDSPGDPEKAPSESEHDGVDKAEVAQTPPPKSETQRFFSEDSVARSKSPPTS